MLISTSSRLKITLLISFYVIISNTYAQDFNFSQFYNTPLNVNPAYTGKFEQDIRIGAIHRNQWQNFGSPYQTTSFSADMNFYKNPFNFDKMGAGLVFLNDQSPDNIFKNQQILLSGSFFKSLDDENRHKISFGIQAGVGIRSVNANGFIFSNQFNNQTNSFDNSVNSNENISGLNKTDFILNSGINYDFVATKKISLSLASSFFNITMPKEGFSSKNSSIRWNVILGINYRISQKLTITPSIFYVNMASAQILMPGANLHYSLLPQKSRNNFIASIGAWYQVKNAPIVYGGLKYNNIQLGLSYDLTASSLSTLSQTFVNKNILGAWEISLIYVGFLKRGIPSAVSVPCKIF